MLKAFKDWANNNKKKSFNFDFQKKVKQFQTNSYVFMNYKELDHVEEYFKIIINAFNKDIRKKVRSVYSEPPSSKS